MNLNHPSSLELVYLRPKPGVPLAEAAAALPDLRLFERTKPSQLVEELQRAAPFLLEKDEEGAERIVPNEAYPDPAALAPLLLAALQQSKTGQNTTRPDWEEEADCRKDETDSGNDYDDDSNEDADLDAKTDRNARLDEPPATRIKKDDDFKRAWQAMNEGQNVFVTGRAGTGKSTLLRQFRDAAGAGALVCAPTGAAAVNVGGVTIHSLFGFRPPEWHWKPGKARGKDKREILQQAGCLVIDEISMVTPDLLDAVDRSLRFTRENEAPFGGLRTIFMGDLFQLPPVPNQPPEALQLDPPAYETNWFFSASVLDEIDLQIVELETIRRQNDPAFIAALNAVREGDASDETLAYFNQRVLEDFGAAFDGPFITLTATNKLADQTNRRRLQELPGEERRYSARIEGKFPEGKAPAERELPLKPGAQVMFIRNKGDQWFNGALGTVVELGGDALRVRLREEGEEKIVEVGRETWDNNELSIDQETGKIKSVSKGSFRQFPLRLAWAMTIHKSQGKTFSRMALDLGNGAFAPGQTYVALSRCRTLEGLALRQPLRAADVRVDPALQAFMQRGER